MAAAQTGQPSGASNIARNSTPPQSTKSTSSAPRTSDSHASFKVKDVPLIVLNNTTTTGLAAQAAQRFEGGGWTVTSVSNYQNSILSTCAYYDPAVTGAKAAATALQRQYPTIKRVAPRFAPDPGAEPLPAGPIVVVLTPDYSAA
ncbi:MAG TPA: LytR C-terminal domain-containing protein [Jatrophihabitans sp.]|nr:LytR C-terminal domain-containing protein [Jatrophihabitans sp.]